MTSPDPTSWASETDRLRKWFYAYLALWIPGLLLFILSLPFGSSLLALSLIPWVVSIVRAYRVQRQLHAAGLSRTHAWTVIAGALLLNVILGFFIPAAVLWSARRAKGRLRNAPAT